ncbi:YebC/PmpR family DNA-binding transcriptional regulator [Candidatus Lariskella endosymbiont of Hedychridium roseum]|uniref:YebC/PmpR family DNA-binding transcriptional regulator n=1 Tax=Candidatus Lariskella endosymbiont of Hedychridium roseum TaxID=3077949 RepID=UPI0030CD9DA5
MAGHSKFKNIMHRKGAQDQKRAKMFTKVVREIVVAARSGHIDPAFNPRLRAAIALAREVNMPKDRVEAAIAKATSNTEDSNYHEIRYEGYGLDGAAFIIEALTDNKNRTAGEVRSAFSKYGGTLAETGSVSYLFQRLGIVVYNFASKAGQDRMLEIALDAGALDCIFYESECEIVCDHTDFHSTREKLESELGTPSIARLIWKPNAQISLSEDKLKTMIKLIDILEDNDDVQNVYHNFTIPDSMAELD